MGSWIGASKPTGSMIREASAPLKNSGLPLPPGGIPFRCLIPPKEFYGQQNVALARLALAIKGDAPILQTLFSPLTTARKLAGDRIFSDLHTDPDLLKEGLETITAVTIQFALEAVQSGTSGFFFATQNASYRWLTEMEYREFGETYDRRILDAVKDKVEFVIVHIHGEDTMFDLLAKYPANILNWHDRFTSPTLYDARRHFLGLLAGGINERGALLVGSPAVIEAEMQDAIRQVSGRGLMLAPGCVVPIHVPEENLMVVRQAVEIH